MRGPHSKLFNAADFLAHVFERRSEHLLALQGVLDGARKARASSRPLSAHCAAILARERTLLVAHAAQSLTQRLEVIKRGVIDFGMMTAQDQLVLVVAEDAALEFAGYGHGGLWYPVPQSTRAGTIMFISRSINAGGEPSARCAAAVNQGQAWRRAPMSSASERLTRILVK